MAYSKRYLNLVLSGGGVKGIAYVGMFRQAELMGYSWGNIVGVSAGAVAGSFAGAGYSAGEIKKILDEFDFQSIQQSEVEKKVPAVARFREYNREEYTEKEKILEFLGARSLNTGSSRLASGQEVEEDRINMLQNVINFGKEGSLYNGDLLEEWIYKALKMKGVRTFADLRGGIKDAKNPGGYKVRMTAVDASRAKIIVLPDDISYYGMDPDRLEVARAVRMSTSVPFAFKPVEIVKNTGSMAKTYYIVDGGVLDNFPFWASDNFYGVPLVGFRLDEGEEPENTRIDFSAPLNMIKKFIAAVHDIGLPKNRRYPKYVGFIDTSKVSFLDFSLSSEEKEYLFNAGIEPARLLFKRMEGDVAKAGIRGYRNPPFVFYIRGGRRFI